jgi:hypothetical protein
MVPAKCSITNVAVFYYTGLCTLYSGRSAAMEIRRQAAASIAGLLREVSVLVLFPGGGLRVVRLAVSAVALAQNQSRFGPASSTMPTKQLLLRLSPYAPAVANANWRGRYVEPDR